MEELIKKFKRSKGDNLMAYTDYSVPDSFDELFTEGENSYHIKDYSNGMDMDNIEAMGLFIECVGIPSEAIVEDFGTQVKLEHADFDFYIYIDSAGMGDFFTHRYEVSIEMKG